MSADVTFGVLGLGSIGRRHATNLASLGRRVIGYDPSAEARDRAAQAGLTVTGARDEVLGQAGAIVICSPNGCHLQDLGDSVAAGRHVFIEKPLAHTTVGVKDLLDRARGEGLTVFAGFNLRFHPAVETAKALLDDGALGRPLWAIFQSSHYLPDWRPDQDYRGGYAADPKTGGVLFDIIHEFDLAHNLLGPAKTLFAAARNTGLLEIASEDVADVVLGHETGVRAQLHLDYVTRPPRRIAEIGGEKGILRVDLIGRAVAVTDTDGSRVHDESFKATGSNDDYVREITAFDDCVTGRARPPCDGYAALAVLESVIDARRMCGLPQA